MQRFGVGEEEDREGGLGFDGGKSNPVFGAPRVTSRFPPPPPPPLPRRVCQGQIRRVLADGPNGWVHLDLPALEPEVESQRRPRYCLPILTYHRLTEDAAILVQPTGEIQ